LNPVPSALRWRSRLTGSGEDISRSLSRLITGRSASALLSGNGGQASSSEADGETHADTTVLRNRGPGSPASGKTRFIGISSGPGGTAVYADGQLKVRRKDLSLLNPDERLAAAWSLGPQLTANTHGQERYPHFRSNDRRLSPEESLRHYEDWRDSDKASPENESLPIASYLFNEQAGRIVKDHSGQETILLIPERFTLLRRSLLIPPWTDFHPSSRMHEMQRSISLALFPSAFFCHGIFLSGG